MLTRQLGLAGAIMGANLRSPDLPYKVTFVATYHCNFRCEMCNIWQKKSVDEMTPEEVALFFEKYPQFKWFISRAVNCSCGGISMNWSRRFRRAVGRCIF